MVVVAAVELGADWDKGADAADELGLIVADGVAVDGDAAGDAVLLDDMLNADDILETMLSDVALAAATCDDDMEAATSED